MNPFPVILFFGLLAIGSLIQLAWTRRVVQRASEWIAASSAPQTWDSSGKLCRVTLLGWVLAALVATVVFVKAYEWFEIEADFLQGCALGSTLWSLLLALISYLSIKTWQALERFAVLRNLAESEGAQDVARLLPAGVRPLEETTASVQRRVSTLGTITNLCLLVVSILVGSALLIVIVNVFVELTGGVGSMLLLGLCILIPGFLTLLFARWAVAAKARRAQLLWFLALTAEKHRPLASELQQWALSHPGRFGSRVQEAARAIAAGASLGDAFDGRGLVAPTELMSIRVGEQTGRLPEALREAALHQTTALKGGLLDAVNSGPVIYLGTVFLVAINIVMFLMYYIVPKFKAIFLGFGTELPGVTRELIDVSDFFVNYAFIFGWFPPLVFWLTFQTYAEAFFKGWTETRLAWRIGVGKQAEVPRILRRLREAVAANVPWENALRPMVRNHHRMAIRSRLERVLGRVTAGMSLWPAMRDSGLLSARDINLLEMAERSNNLPWTLSALADAKERSLAHRWRIILTCLTPVFTIIGGLCVAFVCLAFFMPLVKLLNDLS